MNTPAPVPPAATPPPPTPAPAAGQQIGQANWPKEAVSALLSVAIVGFMLYFMFRMFEAPDGVGSTLWQHQSAILQVAVGLAGTVTGYYFGRIPAERAAATAQQAANSAQQSLVSTSAMGNQAMTNESRIRSQVSDLQRQMTTNTPLGGGMPAQDGAALRAQVAERLDQILRG